MKHPTEQFQQLKISTSTAIHRMFDLNDRGRILPALRLSYLLLSVIIIASCTTENLISIQQDKNLPSTLAANELSHFLGKIYPDYTFSVSDKKAKKSIVLTIDTTMTGWNAYRIITKSDSDTVLSITGKDEQGLLAGVYDFLSSEGCVFLLSENILPKPKKSFLVNDNVIENRALAKRRIILNWHNFLSGCTGWNLKEFKEWIDQSRRMKYNTIMVHSYGNNPMFQFEYNGITKEVGYIANSVRGRDWGIAHVNDVRRMIGGELFEDSVFGADITKLPQDQQIIASQKLMQEVFRYAEESGMEICFAYDFDTDAANSQNIIATLPDAVKLEVNGRYCVRLDLPAGYDYYKAQLLKFKELYPQIDVFTLFFRRNSGIQALWREIEEEDLPGDWVPDFNAFKAQRPVLKNYRPSAASDFAIAQLAKAMKKIIYEIGYDVELTAGSWDFSFIPAMDMVFPEDIPFIPLDFNISYDTDSTHLLFTELKKSNREIIPILWAHHDDFTYLGRPYIPFRQFASLNESRKVNSFGIIHWTTRPLDLYFRNMSNQVWATTKDEEYRVSCDTYSTALIPNDVKFADFIYKWHTESPMIGRETTSQFMHKSVNISAEMIGKCDERLALLNEVKNTVRSYSFFKNYEHFVRSIINDQLLIDSINNNLHVLNKKQLKGLAHQIKGRETIRQYVKTITSLPPTLGEVAMVLSLNLRWLPDYLSVRQLIGLEPSLIKFQPTHFEPLAQAPGEYTFYIDDKQATWLSAGESETGLNAFYDNNGSSYVEVDSVLNFELTTIRRVPLIPGKYRLTIKSNTMDYALSILSREKPVACKKENNVYEFEIKESGAVMRIHPTANNLRLYSLVIEQL